MPKRDIAKAGDVLLESVLRDVEAVQGGLVFVSLPLPAKELSPNARVHWRVKAKHTKAARDYANAAARRFNRPMWKAARVRCVFTFGDSRRRDKDNLLASMKAYFDGLADAGVVENDSQLTYEPIEVTSPSRVGNGVIVEIRPVDATES